MRSATNNIAITVKLDPEIKLRLQKLGHNKQRSTHWLMKQAISAYLAYEEYNEQLKQETLTRWQEAETGQTVDHTAVATWLDTWGSSQEKGRPPCRGG